MFDLSLDVDVSIGSTIAGAPSAVEPKSPRRRPRPTNMRGQWRAGPAIALGRLIVEQEPVQKCIPSH